MRIADPLAVPGLKGFLYLIYILTCLLGIDLCSFIRMLVNVLGSVAVNPYYLLDQLWILFDQLSADYQAAASMIAGEGCGRKTPSIFPADRAVIAGPGSMAFMSTLERSTLFSISHFFITIS
jgi:predicted small lipoprotein YifL